jgi:hypothetical protein
MSAQEDATQDSIQLYAERWATESLFLIETAEEQQSPAVNPWYQAHAPFGAEQELEETYVSEEEDYSAELEDEEFDQGLYELIDEVSELDPEYYSADLPDEQTYEALDEGYEPELYEESLAEEVERSITESVGTDHLLQEHFESLVEEAKARLDEMANDSRNYDFAVMSEEEIETFLDQYQPAETRLPQGFEYLLDDIQAVAKRLFQVSKFEAVSKAIGEGEGRLVLKPGRIGRPEANLRSTALVPAQPTSNLKKALHLNDGVLVERVYKARPQDTLSWYYIYTGAGDYGWVRSENVILDPPEPEAKAHYVEAGEKLIDIAAKYYKPSSGFEWGDDARFYVAALAFVNRDRRVIIFPEGWKQEDWKKTDSWKNIWVNKGHTLWIPKREVLQPLKGQFISSGSITFEMWQAAKLAARVVWEWVQFGAAFVAGLVRGALESIYDLFADAVGLVRSVGSIVKSLVTGEIIGDAKALWKAIESLNLSEMARDFLNKWDSKDPWDKGYFRGTVIGYVIVELLLTIFSVGVTTAVRWVGRVGKFAKVASLLAKNAKVMSVVNKLSKIGKLPEAAAEFLRSKLRKGLKKEIVPKRPGRGGRRIKRRIGRRFTDAVKKVLRTQARNIYSARYGKLRPHWDVHHMIPLGQVSPGFRFTDFLPHDFNYNDLRYLRGLPNGFIHQQFIHGHIYREFGEQMRRQVLDMTRRGFSLEEISDVVKEMLDDFIADLDRQFADVIWERLSPAGRRLAEQRWTNP